MILFATSKNYKYFSTDMKTVTVDYGIKVLSEYVDKRIDFKNDIVLGLDVETNGLDAYKNTTLLVTIGIEKTKVVFDVTKVEDKVKVGDFIHKYNFTVRWLGANIKFDNNMMIVNHGVGMDKMYDTMIAEQRIYQNMDYGFSLVAQIERHVKTVYKPLDKSIRDRFIGANPDRHYFVEKEIRYAADDIKYLFPIKLSQEKLIERYNLHFLLYGIEFPLINVLSEMELEGFIMNKEQWKQNIAKNEDEKFALECKMDEQLRNYRDTLLKGEDRLTMIGGMYDQERKRHPKIISSDLFGGEVTFADMQGSKGKKKAKVKINTNNVNYSSPTQMIRIFGNLKQLMPTKFGRYIVPVMKRSKSSTGDVKIIIANKDEQFTTTKEYLEQYIIRYPGSEIIDWVQNLINFRKVAKKLDSFGETFIKDYINPVTGKLHTVFRQCVEPKGDGTDGKAPVNGRLSSGDTKRNLPNMQNIPTEEEYRTSFGTEPGYSLTTCDLGGAEIICMVSKGKDTKLFKYAIEGDFHSYAATHGWRRIYALRYQKLKALDPLQGTENYKAMIENYNLAKTFVVSKTENKDKRKVGKNMHFGIFYGLGNKKGAETLNISQEEAEVYINFVKKAFPVTVETLTGFEKFAIKNGYLVIDKRTNARIWFPEIVRNIRANREIRERNQTARIPEPEIELDFMHIIRTGHQARNIPVSGTQANMLKEAMNEIYAYIKRNKLDCKIMLQVHDELVVRCPKNMDGQSEEWENNPQGVWFTPDKPFFAADMEQVEYYSVNNYKDDIDIVNGMIIKWKVDFPRFVQLTMCEVANRYLNGFKMKAEYHVADTWIK